MIDTDFLSFQAGLEASKRKILAVMEDAKDITFFRPKGNIGDHLIWAGTRQLLANFEYKELLMKEAKNVKGHTALISGGGGWCKAFNIWPRYLPIIEERFERVIILPTSFDPSIRSVKRVLSNTKALVFAREIESYNLIKALCNADYAYDCAFFFDFSPYKSQGKGTLFAYRIDPEQASTQVPSENNDISVTCSNLDQWLKVIAKHEIIKTDRAHVMIASAMLGKHVFYRLSNYHKVSGIAKFSLKEFPVFYDEGR